MAGGLSVIISVHVVLFLCLQLQWISANVIRDVNAAGDPTKKVVCYFANWSQYRPGQWSFKASDIDANICTHIIVAFAKIDSQNFDITPLEWNDEATYATLRGLKNKNPSLKILIAIGGWSVGSWPFSQLTQDETSRKTFAQNAATFLRNQDFDGLDIDWEYPLNMKQQFSNLLNALHDEFHRGSADDDLLLTAALSASVGTISASYDIPTIAKYLDFANIMTYDLRGAWELPRTTAMHSALYPAHDSDSFTVDSTIQYYIKHGMPAEKVILGVPLYGRGWTLSNPLLTAIGSPADAPSAMGSYSREEGILSYFEICTAGWTKEFDDTQKVAFAYSRETKQWVGYDDAQSAAIKAEYMVEHKLGGALFWELGFADFRNECGQGAFPVIKSMNNALGNDGGSDEEGGAKEEEEEEEEEGEEEEEEPVDERRKPGEVICDSTFARVPDPSDCTRYFQCFYNDPKYRMWCPGGTNFDAVTRNCRWPRDVQCGV